MHWYSKICRKPAKEGDLELYIERSYCKLTLVNMDSEWSYCKLTLNESEHIPLGNNQASKLPVFVSFLLLLLLLRHQ